ncbi:Thioredoxin [Lampropedia hyalina DSM 16112]|uniref:Thioredoxin n=1 Tax=Lampropedia hyalina DSM 16112 TaxID=1122156 RepID=A0A1M4XRK9_9BURK|nr:thioredoxin family protein [Lampropedia hyalina]SHE96224.1 Thioredoxin [Lampropedia hyalina DSM 16112]
MFPVPCAETLTLPASARPHGLWVIVLCAQWCGVCRDYEPMFWQLSAQFPGVHFAWLDVEDDAVSAALGDQEVETFPTVAAGFAGSPEPDSVLFQGAVMPQIGILKRMIQDWLEMPAPAPHSPACSHAAAVWPDLLALAQQADDSPF